MPHSCLLQAASGTGGGRVHTLAGDAGGGGDATLALQVALDLALQLAGLGLVQGACCVSRLQGHVVEAGAAGGHGRCRLHRMTKKFRRCASVWPTGHP